MKEYKVKENVINALLAYLSNQPYGEVHELIAVLQQSQPIEEEKPKK